MAFLLSINYYLKNQISETMRVVIIPFEKLMKTKDTFCQSYIHILHFYNTHVHVCMQTHTQYDRNRKTELSFNFENYLLKESIFHSVQE